MILEPDMQDQKPDQQLRGMDLSEGYYREYGKPMLMEQFGDIMPLLAAGFFGSGSECMGYDDQVSRDHDFEPGFCILVPGEDLVDRRTVFLLERAYSKLPREYKGFKRSLMNPVGGSRHGVIRITDFFMEKTGSPDGRLTAGQWLSLPGQALCEAVNGKVFFDHYGELSRIRGRLACYPENIRKKKLAGHLLMMAQAGQYNYRRCLLHGEPAAAQMAVFAFVKSAMEVLFLLNRTYMPYYKWSFRALRDLPIQAWQAELLEFLICSDNEKEMAREKMDVIEGIAEDVITELAVQGLSRASCYDLEKHAYSVNDQIQDSKIRNLSIFAGSSSG